MGITTRRGDKLTTDLYQGGKIPKSDLRCQACGSGDEVISFLGFSLSLINDRKLKSIITALQKDIFAANAEIMSSSSGLKRLKVRVNSRSVKRIERYIRDFEGKIKNKHNCFFLPGDNTASASFNICRAVARRAELEVVRLAESGLIENRYLVIYYNRLSDLLYLISLKLKEKA
ncbi:MAG: cob(I)yrinic acid a,c-diamide adenosyltransferase [Candidatus Omnitrophica bacterium]|nr:cob(I)yrinic acid a,c-diamide adenosyltransferase [Candidatus Omnitrophota bacterium]MBD3268733.1 cob(I)yrinic acid a,c-diamide adenosyltransferase [Candidatus Omnitrophota bacterium]